jgi:hypothetical protein
VEEGWESSSEGESDGVIPLFLFCKKLNKSKNRIYCKKEKYLINFSVSKATDLATGIFLKFKLKITVSKSVSKATEKSVAKYRSLIRSLYLYSNRFSDRLFFYFELKISVSKSVAKATEIFRLPNRLLKANFLVVVGANIFSVFNSKLEI